MRIAIFTLLMGAAFGTHSQSADWFNLDPVNDGVMGVSVNRAYQMIPSGKTVQPVIVAVIDDGVDIFHPDFEGRIWTNTGEIPDNGIDDDGNGYIDDVHGWNFLGNPQGENIEFETLEITRLLSPLAKRFDNVDPKSISKSDKKDYRDYVLYRDAYTTELDQLQEELGQFAQISALMRGAYAFIQERTGQEQITMDVLQSYTPADDDERQILEFLIMAEMEGVRAYIDEAEAYFDKSLNYHYNMDYNPRTIVNEAEAKAKGTAYGNNMVWAANPSHGTHVAGIIGAVRNNGSGIDGIASNALIMPLRAVPGGDERDEDIALAIRYAADNGARVINMSFGKSYSPNSKLVLDAIRYACSKDVLMIHAAGNDTENLEKSPNYPDGTLGKKTSMPCWINVGASGPVNDNTLLADFSNFGVKKVDVLAPGVEILSLAPEESVKPESGTSMAAPVVSGVATLLRGLYPTLTAQQVKQLIIDSLYKPEGAVVVTEKGDVSLSKVVRYPGIVNAERAVVLGNSRYEK